MKDKMKKVIEMTHILTEMDTDAYMQCKYMLLVVSKGRRSEERRVGKEC